MNLLPWSRRRLLAREYHFRLGVIALLIFTTLILDTGILLFPTYVFLGSNVKAQETVLADITTALSSSDEMALSTRLTTLSNNATTLIALAKTSSVSDIMREILSIPHKDISLSGFVFAQAANKSKNVITLAGVAKTRDALRAYQLALQGMPFILSVNLPVSAYAQDTNLSFTITLTLKP
jgi:Tfp pilus assembly protein PilN